MTYGLSESQLTSEGKDTIWTLHLISENGAGVGEGGTPHTEKGKNSML